MDKIIILKEQSDFEAIKDQVTWHSDYIKGVVDLKNYRMSLGGALHADGEKVLLRELDVESEYLWGFNLYPDQELEFESLINIKPKLGNKSTLIASEDIKNQVRNIIFKLIKF